MQIGQIVCQGFRVGQTGATGPFFQACSATSARCWRLQRGQSLRTRIMTTLGNHTFFGESQPGADGISILQVSHVPQQLLTTFSIMLRLFANSA